MRLRLDSHPIVATTRMLSKKTEGSARYKINKCLLILPTNPLRTVLVFVECALPIDGIFSNLYVYICAQYGLHPGAKRDCNMDNLLFRSVVHSFFVDYSMISGGYIDPYSYQKDFVIRMAFQSETCHRGLFRSFRLRPSIFRT
jgi:hypothetical protein